LSVVYCDSPPGLVNPQSDPFFIEEREMLAAIGERLASVIKNRRTSAELDQHRLHLEELVGERTRQYEGARDAAEAANHAKSAFLANMSHEIRTPLNAIIGLTHLVQNDIAEPKQQQRLGKVGDAARHLLALINDILDLSKIEAGRLTLESIDFTLSKVIDEVSDLLHDKAHEKSLAWQVTLDPTLPPYLNGDPLRLGQVLINFASNAVKFTEQGSVTLAVTRLSAGDEPLWLRFALTDSGIGLSAEAVARLFQPFEQADMSTTRRFGGTGLGLAIVKRIADLMGGRVGVDSTPGEGSTFWLEAPFGMGQAPVAVDLSARMNGLMQVAAGAVSDVVENGFADQVHTRILLAEDNPINQEVALDLLEAVGLSADVAANGREALEFARAHCYALILMDVQMPEMDGIEATLQIRVLEGGATAPGVPIIAMTANVFAEDRRKCLDAGMSDHLPKPVTPADFYRMLHRWLPTATEDAQQKVGVTEGNPRGTGGTVTESVSSVMPVAPVAAHRLPDIPGLDIQAGLASVGGRTATYQRLLRMFIDHHADCIAQIRAALTAGQRDEARRLAHSLKGAASTLGAESLRAAALKAELAIKSGAAHEEVEAALAALAVPLDALVGGLRAYVESDT
jgi:signal transduction histidine kinase/CheY-like chemotaxis protein